MARVNAVKAAEAIGVHPNMMRKYARVNGCPHLRDGRKMSFDIDEVKVWYEKWKEIRGKKSKAPKDAADGAPIDWEKLPRNQDCVLWNRGEWRGWAVAHATQVDETFVQLLVDYAENKQFYLTPKFRDSVARGEVFIVNPDDTLQFIITQLTRFGSDAPAEAIKLLQSAAERIKMWRVEQESKADDPPTSSTPDSRS